MKIHSRSSKSKRQVADRPEMVMYTCGPTVYDDAHIGNFRSFIMADALRRWLESDLRLANPPAVRHVMNITDIGHLTTDDLDRMQVGANRLGVSSSAEVADYYASRFIEDAQLLNIKVASEDSRFMPRASDFIEDMIRAIESLVESGHAYVCDSGVFYDVSSFPRKGEIAGDRSNDQSGMGGRLTSEQAEAKRSSEDFLLWKIDSDHLMNWPSPWGNGYPGWHIECSVMASAMGHDDMSGIIDIHTGGEDNAFPHHEAENAQSCSMFGRDPHKTVFSRHWLHIAHLHINNKKMSKSDGSFIRIRDLIGFGVSAAAIRLFLLSAHYRTNLLYDGPQSIAQYERMIEKWRTSDRSEQTDKRFAEEFAAALDDDFNTAKALGVVNSYLGLISDADWQRIETVLGIDDMELRRVLKPDIEYRSMSDEAIRLVEPIAESRREARISRDYALSDRLREEIASLGYEVEDMPQSKYLIHPSTGGDQSG